VSVNVSEIFSSIGIDKDYSKFDFTDYQPDLQGWGSQKKVFSRVITAIKPKLIIEVGTWKGASAAHMLQLCKEQQVDAQIICIDTWLGSNDVMWTNPNYRSSLNLVGGYPTIFKQFIFNMTNLGLMNSVFPLPMTSSAAYFLLRRFNVQADLIYIDAGHEHDEVLLDLNYYFELLRPGGIMFGDDYSHSWPGVISAVNQFASERRLLLEAGGGKFAVSKSQAQARKKRKRAVPTLKA
jgi:hypothetical protein